MALQIHQLQNQSTSFGNYTRWTECENARRECIRSVIARVCTGPQVGQGVIASGNNQCSVQRTTSNPGVFVPCPYRCLKDLPTTAA